MVSPVHSFSCIRLNFGLISIRLRILSKVTPDEATIRVLCVQVLPRKLHSTFTLVPRPTISNQDVLVMTAI
jgi:hypothetical protein